MTPLALADKHRVAQAQLANRVMVLLGEVWRRTMHPGAVDRSFETFAVAALAVIGPSRLQAVDLAQYYYEQSALMAGGQALDNLPVPQFDAAQTVKDLRYTGPIKVKKKVGEGESVDVAMRMALGESLRVASSAVVDAGRDHLLNAAKHDPQITRYSWVASSSPCSFCAMQVSRGPIFTKRPDKLGKHKGCKCNVLLDYESAPTGMTPDAKKYNDLWKEFSSPDEFQAAIRLMRGETADSAVLRRNLTREEGDALIAQLRKRTI